MRDGLARRGRMPAGGRVDAEGQRRRPAHAARRPVDGRRLAESAMIRAIAAALALALLANDADAAVLTPSVTRNMIGSVDGIALGDVNGDGRDEIAVTV